MTPGSIRGSVVSLIALTMGAGTLTIPYIISLNGLIFGSFLIVFGALISYYTGMLLVLIANLLVIL